METNTKVDEGDESSRQNNRKYAHHTQ